MNYKTWLKENADRLGSIFGIAPFAAVALILIVQLGFLDTYKELIIVASIVVIICSIFVLFKTALTIHYEETINSSQSFYELNVWSLETLKAVGVSKDITKCLRTILDDAKSSKPDIKLQCSDECLNRSINEREDWLAKLEECLGKTRVDECSAMIRKYTKRQKIIVDPKTVKITKLDNSSSVSLNNGETAVNSSVT